MTISNIKGHIYGLISEIAAAEKITKVKLALLSRDILPYVMESQDIQSVNRLLEILSPMNKRVATLFFRAFLPWKAELTVDGAFIRFGEKDKGEKRIKKAEKAVADFLSDENNTLWTWADANVEVEVKKKDFSGMIEKAVAQALSGDEKSDTPAISRADVLTAVFKAGVSIDDMLAAAGEMETQQQTERDAAQAVMDTRDVDVPQAEAA